MRFLAGCVALAAAIAASWAFWHALRPTPERPWSNPRPATAGQIQPDVCRHHGHAIGATDTPGWDSVGKRHLYTVTCSTGYVVSYGSDR